MRLIQRHKLPAVVGLALLAALVGGGAFAAARLVRQPATQAVTTGDAQAAGQPTPGTPFADAPGTDEAAGATIMAEWAKPEFVGTINGIIMRSGAEPTGQYELPCALLDANISHRDISIASGTSFAIFNTGLPAGLKASPDYSGAPEPATATLCSGAIVGAGRNVVVAATNHPIHISTVLRPEPWNFAYGSADRVSATTIGGRPAVLTRSPLPDGRGGSYITMVQQAAEGFIITQLDGPNSPIGELVTVAEELTK
jgi:hypothetical protein